MTLFCEDARQARVVARVDVCRLADGLQHALGGGGVGQRVALALGEVVLEREFLLAGALVARSEMADDVHAISCCDCGPAAPRGMHRRTGKFW
jgi:hypothetical protein